MPTEPRCLTMPDRMRTTVLLNCYKDSPVHGQTENMSVIVVLGDRCIVQTAHLHILLLIH